MALVNSGTCSDRTMTDVSKPENPVASCMGPKSNGALQRMKMLMSTAMRGTTIVQDETKRSLSHDSGRNLETKQVFDEIIFFHNFTIKKMKIQACITTSILL